MLRRKVACVALAFCLASAVSSAHAGNMSVDYLGGHIGYSFPVTSTFDDFWKASLHLSGSLRHAASDHVLLGLEVGFESHDFDFDQLNAEHPAFQFSGGNLELLPITFEGDYLFCPDARVRPLVNLGIGAYFVFTDLVQATGPVSGSFNTYSDETLFGMHAGAGLFIPQSWGGIRIDAVYHQAFHSGDDLGYVPVRIGVLWNPH